jgi:hypothetical protein
MHFPPSTYMHAECGGMRLGGALSGLLRSLDVLADAETLLLLQCCDALMCRQGGSVWLMECGLPLPKIALLLKGGADSSPMGAAIAAAASHVRRAQISSRQTCPCSPLFASHWFVWYRPSSHQGFTSLLCVPLDVLAARQGLWVALLAWLMHDHGLSGLCLMAFCNLLSFQVQLLPRFTCIRQQC